MTEETNAAAAVLENNEPKAEVEKQPEERVTNKFKALYEQDKAVKEREAAVKEQEGVVGRFGGWDEPVKTRKNRTP